MGDRQSRRLMVLGNSHKDDIVLDLRAGVTFIGVFC